MIKTISCLLRDKHQEDERKCKPTKKLTNNQEKNL
jgi:hypothetical protein